MPALSEHTRPASARHCPQCAGPVVRVEREAGDKLLSDAHAWRRYRCRDAACGWGGLMQVQRRHRNHLEQIDSVPMVVRVGVSALALLVVAGMAWGLLQMLSSLIEN